MTTMTIPDVSQRTWARLRVRAELNGRTVEEEVRALLDAAADTANTVYLFSLHEALSEALEAEFAPGLEPARNEPVRLEREASAGAA